MINFCCPSLNPTVTTNTISNDGYEITNLVSKDPVRRRKGFLAYNAIKPPVTVTVNFLCNVNVSHVVLWTQIGCQKSTGFEISARSSSKIGADGTQYQVTAFGYLDQNDVGIIFYRKIYYSDYLKSTSHLSRFARKTFPGQAYSLLNNVSSLQIKIIKTSSSVPALARVEVWGHPSRYCDPALRQNVLRLWKTVTEKGVVISHIEKSESQAVATPVSESEADMEIPEEFLDSITYSLMVLPMALPCGKIVDQSTLERHKEFEANWGRAPSDPFTGKVFTETSKPVLATSLKARIDRFLVEHSEKQEFWTVPRTVGRKESHDVYSSRNVCKVTSTVTSSVQRKSSYTSMSMYSSNTGLKRRVDISEDLVKRKICKVQEDVDTGKQEKGNFPLTYEEEVDWSLDSALQATLSGLPKYTEFSSALKMKDECGECKTDNKLYTLPCGHFVCRNCLVLKKQSQDLICYLCKGRFEAVDPVRYHSQ